MPLSFAPQPAAVPMRSLLLLLLLTSSSYLVLPVVGFPSGAGGCVSGAPSVGSPHLPSTTGDLTLSGNGIEVSVDGTVLDPSTPFSITAGSEHVITVSATGATPFRGFLVALSTSTSQDLSAALAPQDTAIGQTAGACSAPLFGVTHISRDDKTTASALFNLAEDAELTLDVTVVILNSNGVSQYGYDGYKLTNSAAAAVTSAPTAAPAAAATGAPVAAATGAPAAVPAVTTAPSAAPVAAAPTVPATPTYGGGGTTPTWTMSDAPSMVPTPGTGTGTASDLPSIIPTVDDAGGEPSQPSAPTAGGQPDGGGSGGGGGTSGANAARCYGSALAAGAVVVAGIALAM